MFCLSVYRDVNKLTGYAGIDAASLQCSTF